MSIWTHVTGVIRYDDFMSDRAEAYKKMRWLEETFFLDAPHGSEGPMEYTVIPTHSYRKNGRVTVHGPGLCDIVFGGDFRDFDKDAKPDDYDGSWQELREWFDVITSLTAKKDNIAIRQAVMLMQSYDDQEVLTYKEPKE